MNRFRLTVLLLVSTIVSSAARADLACVVQAGGCDEILPTAIDIIAARNRTLPGKKLCIRAGTYRSLDITSLKGAAGNPVTISNCGGKVVIDSTLNTANAWQVGINGHKAQYVHITGTGDSSIMYGIEQKNAGTHGVDFDQGITDIEVDHLEIHHNYYMGIGIRSYPRCDGLHNRSNFTQYNTILHHNYIHHAQTGEGVYIGTSHYQQNVPMAYAASCPSTPYLEPPLRNVKVYNNIIEDIGRDGIQVGAAISGMEIYNNVVKRYALNQAYGHIGGLQINPGSVGKVYNNWVESAGGINENAIQYAGGGDGPLEIYDNVLLKSKMSFMILGHLLSPTNTTLFRNNTVVNDGGSLLYFFCYATQLSASNPHAISVQNNIFTGYTTVGSFIYTDGAGKSWYKIFDQGANYCPINGATYNSNLEANLKIPGNFYSNSVSDVQFVDPANGNYDLKLTSPALDKGANYSDPSAPSGLACTIQTGGCDVILNPNSNQGFEIDGRKIGAAFYAGKKVCIRSRPEPYTYIWMYQTGGEENRPVTITNCGGQVVFKKSGTGSVISFEQSSFIRFTGNGSADPYGIVLHHERVAEPLQASGHFINAGPGSSDIEIDHVEIKGNPVTWDQVTGKPILSGGVGIAAETYPRCSDGKWKYGTWEMKNMKIHHNYIHDTLLEGIYLGPSHFGWVAPPSWSVGYGACDPKLFEAAGRNVVVEDNIVENTGNDAMQAGGIVDGLVIRRNRIKNFGLHSSESHSTGIQIGQGSKAFVDSNWIENTSNPYRTQGLKHGGTNGSIYSNNVVIGVRVGIELNGQSDVVMELPAGTAYFYHNTFVNMSAEALGVYCSRLGTVQLVNNIFAGYGNQTYNGSGSLGCIGSFLTTNKFYPTAAETKFINPAQGNYRLQESSSAANSGTSLAGIIDKDHENADRTGAYDFGAFVIDGAAVSTPTPTATPTPTPATPTPTVAPPSVNGQKWYVSFRGTGGIAPASPWNAFSGDGGWNTKVLNSLKNEQGTTTSVSLEVVAGFAGVAISGGLTTGNNSGVVPDSVLSGYYYTGSSSKFVIKNLNANNRYHLTMTCSRQASGSRRTTYTVNGMNQSMECVNNTSQSVKFTQMAPNTSGQIEVTVARYDAAAGYGYINGLIIEELAPNQAPILSSLDEINVAEGQSVNVTFNGVDPDSDTLTFNEIAKPAFATLSGSTASSRTYTLNPSYAVVSESTDFTLTLGVADATHPAVQKTVLIHVANTNRTPVLSGPSEITVREGQSLSLTISGSDPDGDSLAFTDMSKPNFAALSSSSGSSRVYQLAPLANAVSANSDVTLSVQASDGSLSAAKNVIIHVVNNPGPVVSAPAEIIVLEGHSASVNFTASDADGDTLSFSEIQVPAFANFVSVSTNPRVYQVSPGLNTVAIDGVFPLSVKVSDGLSESVREVLVRVRNNSAPTLSASSVLVAEGQVGEIVFNASDVDGEALTFSPISLPSFASVKSTSTGQQIIELRPPAQSVSTDTDYTVTIEVRDGAHSVMHSANVRVMNANEIPVITSDVNEISAQEAEVKTVQFQFSDLDGDVLSVTEVDKPTFVRVISSASGSRSYEIAPTIDLVASGAQDFPLKLKVEDGKGGSSEKQIMIHVSDLPGGIVQQWSVNLASHAASHVDAPAPWNNFRTDGGWSVKSMSSLKNDKNQVTSVSVEITIAGGGVQSAGGMTSNGAMPGTVLQSYFYSTDRTAEVTMKGLRSDRKYTVKVICSRSGSGSRITRYTVGGVTKELECMNNINGMVVFTNVAPNTSLNIPVAFIRKDAAAAYGYLNGLIIEEMGPSAIP